MKNLNSTLRAMAINLGMCNEWRKMWNRDFDSAELISLYKRGIDFAIEHDFPSPDFIVRNFSKRDREENGIFICTNIDTDEQPLSGGTYVILGNCTGTMRFKRWTAARVYVRHESDVRIEAEENSRIFIHVLDDAKVQTSGDGTFKLYIRE